MSRKPDPFIRDDHEPDILGILDELERMKIASQHDAKRHLVAASRLSEMKAVLVAKFRADLSHKKSKRKPHER